MFLTTPTKTKKTKLHLACGEVYLSGYINVDIVGDLASESPLLAAEKITDLTHYYKRPYIKGGFGLSKHGRNVVDVRADVANLNMFADESVDEILSANLIDHFRFQDLPKVIKEWGRVLKPDGILIIDVGDCVGNAKMIVEAKNKEDLEWALRLMYCHSRDTFDSHHWGFTPNYLEELMIDWGFMQIWSRDDYIKHVYPSFQSAFKKRQ